MAKRKQPTIRVYRTYRFISKDPVIDKMRTAIQAEAARLGVKEHVVWRQIEEAGGPKAGTHKGWFRGGTRKPQHAACEASMRAIGKEFAIVDSKKD